MISEKTRPEAEYPEAGYLEKLVETISSAAQIATSSVSAVATAERITNTLTQSLAASVADPFEKMLGPQLLPPKSRDRATLLVQSPYRIYFYWSFRSDPYKRLKRAFTGQTGSYSLCIRLINLTTGETQYYLIENEDSWWFKASPKNSYRAEVGFYAPNRPFVRILSSNLVKTPSAGPSARAAREDAWEAGPIYFDELLKFSGFAQSPGFADEFDEADFIDYGEFIPFLQKLFQEASALDWHNLKELKYALELLSRGKSLDQISNEISGLVYSLLLRLGISKSQHIDFSQFAEEIRELDLSSETLKLYRTGSHEFIKKAPRRFSFPQTVSSRPVHLKSSSPSYRQTDK
jgi:hypothetical protein